ncbi:pyridoxal-5'-phosphate-dependent protein [Marinicauda salina]|uniref:Pyridoxal-5'-phosphate-dependent protein n=1 Tax=Marinicauda salina TaxID=2135793 RepID=A0A2U2BVD2_9PROT|nr:threonine/serine dehydratase [Marinicauda salina]PWE17950.1 pyridoxal-5'-phosphate-dependent protein [Marinicauda salina]
MTDTDSPPTFDDVASAAARLEGLAVRTPLIHHPELDAAIGGRVFLKAETLQRTGSFKFRGAYNAIAQLPPDARERGVVAFSSGNHAQGVAEAARLLGVKATIVMPSDAPAVKADGVRRRGAELITYDRERDSREAIAAKFADESGATVIPSFDHRDVIAGQGTCGLEIFETLTGLGETADQLVCCVGGGGLIAGIGIAAAELSADTQLYGAEPEGFDDHRRSLESGRIETNERRGGSICDALLSEAPGRLTFELNRRRLSGVGVVSDAEALDAVAFAFARLKLVIEPGGAAALAAVLSGKIEARDRTTVVVATGANVDPALFGRVIAG